jgi:hypothetical protein
VSAAPEINHPADVSLLRGSRSGLFSENESS